MFERHTDVIQQVTAASSVMFVGGMDTGKTTLAMQCARAAVADGRSVGYVDADLNNSIIGPPACVGLKYFRSPDDFDRLDQADALHFVGAISRPRPRRHFECRLGRHR